MTTGRTDSQRRADLLARVERDEAELQSALEDVRRLARETVAVPQRAGHHIRTHPYEWVVGSSLAGLWLGSSRHGKETSMEFAREFTRNLPSSDDIMRALGGHLRQQHSTGSDAFSSLALFGAGLLVGAGLALLFAPREGRHLREELGERASHLRERVTSAAHQVKGQAQEALQHYGESDETRRTYGESQYGQSGR